MHMNLFWFQNSNSSSKLANKINFVSKLIYYKNIVGIKILGIKISTLCTPNMGQAVSQGLISHIFTLWNIT